MSSVTVRLTKICSGGGHLTFAITGDVIGSTILDREELSGPIREDDPFAVVVCKLAKKVRTIPQAIALMQSGVVITV